MKVKVLDRTEGREKTVCKAARGDYMKGWNGDQSFGEIMATVDYDEDCLTRAKQNNYYPEISDKTEAKLISFIEKQISRGHYGPLEQSYITFSVKGVSRVTMAQITRHRHLTFDVQSMRYADFSEQEIVVPATLLSDEQRHERYPNIYDEDGSHFNRDEGVFDMSEEKREHWRISYIQLKEQCREFYQDMVDAGIPKEDARFMLPLGTTVNMTFSGNARTFLHLLDMRRKANAQWEIRELSEALLDELFDWMPYSFSYYEENGPNKLSP